MKLSDLKSSGGIVSDEPIRRSVSWSNDGEVIEFDILVKQLAFGDMDRIRRAAIDVEDSERCVNAILISESIILDDGERMTYEDAYRLKPTLAKSLLEAIGDALSPKS